MSEADKNLVLQFLISLIYSTTINKNVSVQIKRFCIWKPLTFSTKKQKHTHVLWTLSVGWTDFHIKGSVGVLVVIFSSLMLFK